MLSSNCNMLQGLTLFLKLISNTLYRQEFLFFFSLTAGIFILTYFTHETPFLKGNGFIYISFIACGSLAFAFGSCRLFIYLSSKCVKYKNDGDERKELFEILNSLNKKEIELLIKLLNGPQELYKHDTGIKYLSEKYLIKQIRCIESHPYNKYLYKINDPQFKIIKKFLKKSNK